MGAVGLTVFTVAMGRTAQVLNVPEPRWMWTAHYIMMISWICILGIGGIVLGWAKAAAMTGAGLFIVWLVLYCAPYKLRFLLVRACARLLGGKI